MKTLLHYTFDSPADGRPTKEHQALYDLPIQSFAFASFELGFAAPDEGLYPRAQVQKAVQLLQKGLLYASGAVESLDSEDEEREAILSATLLLTPPSTGPIKEVQVSGVWMPGRVELTRAARTKIREQLRTTEEHVVTYKGRIGELDIDKLSLTLRDTDDQQDHLASFNEELLEDIEAFFHQRSAVEVAGIERKGKLRISLVVRPNE